MRTVEWIEVGVGRPVGIGVLTEGLGSQVQSLQISMNLDNMGIGSPRGNIAEDGKAGDNTCAMANFLNTQTGTAWTSGVPGSVSAYPAGELCALAAAKKQPPPGPPPPPPPQPCPAGQKRDIASGTCVAIVCPAGQQLNPTTNQCELVAPVTTTGTKKSNWGLALLGAAAVVAGLYALG